MQIKIRVYLRTAKTNICYRNKFNSTKRQVDYLYDCTVMHR